MRHFEFKDDKSSKFWQVEQSDSALNLRWGKMGTQGQSQTKNFDNEAKASAAMAKLVKEKTGKGYVEKGVDDHAAIGAPPPKPKAKPLKTAVQDSTEPPTVSTPQVSAATVLSQSVISVTKPTGEMPPWLASGDPISLPHAIRVQALSNRHHPGEMPPLNSQKSWNRVCDRLNSNGGVKPNANKTCAKLRQAFIACLHRLAERQMDGSLEVDAVLFALGVSINNQQYATENTQDITEFLVASKGLPYAIDVLLLAQEINVETRRDPATYEEHYYLNEDVREPLNSSWVAPYSWPELYFRQYLSCADEDEWQICVDKLIAGIPRLPVCRQPLIALLLPERPDVANRLANALLQQDEQYETSWLQLVANDEGVLQSLRELGQWFHRHNLLDCEFGVATLIAERGLDAVPILAGLPEMEVAGDALAYIGTPEAITALATVVEQRTHQSRFVDAAHRWPLASIPAIAELLTGEHPCRDMLSACLSNLLLANPGSVAQLLPWMSEGAQTQVQDVIARLAGPIELAEAAELPGVLVNPPWLQQKKKRQTAILTLAPLSLAPRVDLPAELKEQWLGQLAEPGAAIDYPLLAHNLGFNYDDDTAITALKNRDTQGLIDAWMSRIAEYRHDFAMGGTRLLPDEMALALWNGLSAYPCRGVGYMVAKFGEAAMPGLINAVRARPAELSAIWQHVAVSELAPILVSAFLKRKKLRSETLQWLYNHPHHSVIGLIPVALGKKSEAQDCAILALRLLANQGHEALMMQTGEAYGDPKVTEALRVMLDEDLLDRFPGKISPAPHFYQPGGWRRPRLKESQKALPDSALEHLGTMLRFPMADGLYAGIVQVRQACDRDSLADFAWDLFSAWQFAAAPSKENWAFMALGLFGTDDTARKLTPLIRAWPGEAQHQRAVNGLEVLNMIGSDVALMMLNGIAQKVKFRALQDRAREKIAAIAEARDLTIDELGDRIAPDLGLDEHGLMRLDFGERQFTVSFDETLKPLVRDIDGTRLKDLPKPRKSDDRELAAAAVNVFKLLKKDARTVATQQLMRLEIAMCQRRRWTPELFDLFLVRHPLLRHLVQRLVWAVYVVDDGSNYGGKLVDCFRVAEDDSLTTAEDNEYALPAGDTVRVGIPHTLELSAQQAADFGQLFADYELLQPFVQLGRDVYSLNDSERESRELLRWNGVVVPTSRILALVNKGWRRGETQGRGMVMDFIKPIDHTLVFSLAFEPGMLGGMGGEYDEQTLESVVIDEGQWFWRRAEEGKPFTTLDEIILSELIRDMEALRA